MFDLVDTTINPTTWKNKLADPSCGGHVAFEGWVRNHNEGKTVLSLEYEAYAALAIQEGQRILSEAQEKFGITQALAIHRVGHLQIGDLAVWVGVASPHRKAAFLACSYIIDEIKHRLPIWKKEHYADGSAEWVACHH
jgi:molybdopterin synthase catalytic subunit